VTYPIVELSARLKEQRRKDILHTPRKLINTNRKSKLSDLRIEERISKPSCPTSASAFFVPPASFKHRTTHQYDSTTSST
jgi:hypothetical protein